MAQASKWIILTITLIIAIILVPVVVTGVQNAEQQVGRIVKTATLYPSSDDKLQLTVGEGTKDVLTTIADTHWISTHSLSLNVLNENVSALKHRTLKLTVKAKLNNSDVVASIIGNWTIIDASWEEKHYVGKSESVNLTATTNWQNVTFTFNFPEYNVTDKTYRIKFEYYVKVYTPQEDSKITVDFSGCKIENFGYEYYDVSEGWGFTGGAGARTLFMLLPFVFIVGVVVYFIASLLGKI